jgi:YVTN family beta-propeller protein
MSSFLRPLALLALVLPGLLAVLLPSLADTAAPPSPAAGGTRGPSALLFSPDGKTLYITEQDADQVALLDPASGKVLARIPSGGTQPTGLALAMDGRTLAVANSFSGSLGILDLEKRTLRTTVPLPGGPHEVVITTGGQAFVTVSQLDEVAVVDLAAAKVVERISLGVKPGPMPPARPARVPVARRPRALALTPDGTTLLCANMSGGSLSVIDVTSRKELVCVPMPVVNIRGMGVSPDGKVAFLSAQQPHNEQPTAQSETMWSNVLCEVSLAGAESRFGRLVVLDQAGRGAADPTGVTVAGLDGPVYVALAGTHEVAVVPFSKPGVTTETATAAIPRVPVGANPRAVTLRPGMGEVWVANHLGNSLSVLKEGEKPGGRVFPLDPPARTDRRLKGRFLFTSAHLTRGMGFTCNTCHTDGNTDGISWKFAHVPDRVERRNSRNLRGAVLLTAPYGWAAREEDFEEFVNDEVEGLLRSRRLAHGDLHALWDLVNELPLPPNPYRSPDGSMTPAALRGRALFTGKADCASCHGGGQYGGTAKGAWVGTTPKGVTVDVPHLTGAYDSAPYLHDGRAETLEKLFTEHNRDRLHGKAHLLSSAELQDLIQFLREL